ASPQPSALADLTLFPAAPGSEAGLVERFTTERLPGINAGRRVGLWLTGSAPPGADALVAAARRFGAAGGNVFGWCPDDPLADSPPAARVAPDVSASTFPIKF